jgi:folate-binding protein YgfZ
MEIAVTKLNRLSVARFSGPDAGAFLQAQLSADIGALEPGDATFACYCSIRGQVYGLLLVGRHEDHYLVIAKAALLPSILQRLRMFVLRSRVEFSLLDGMEVHGLNETAGKSGFAAVFTPGEIGLSYGLASEDIEASGNPDEWKERELRRKLCWLSPPTSEKFIPQMLGFDVIGAVSFSKGCYPGQEIVARARYLGKVKRKPLLALTDSAQEFPAGSSLRLRRDSDWSNGAVVDSVTTAAGNSLLFIVAPEEPVSAVEELEYDGNSYRCATM